MKLAPVIVLAALLVAMSTDGGTDVAALPQPCAPAQPDVLLLGQSNAAQGHTFLFEAPWDTTLSRDDVRFWNSTGNTSAHESWGYLRILGNGKFGPELTMAQGGERILKVVKGGTPIADWLPGGTMWGTLMLQASLSGVSEAGTIVWLQHENDALTEERADAYEANLTQFISDVRGTFGPARFILVLAHPDLVYAYRDTVRAAQEAVTFVGQDVRAVNIDDLDLSTDSVHYTTETMLEVGRRIGKEIR